MSFTRSIKFICVTAITALLVGCGGGTMPILGGGSGNTVTGAAAGSTSKNKNSQIASCDKTLGTLTIFEDTSRPWWNYYYRHYRHLGSTVPVIRTMIQQSNCFVIVERGAAMRAMKRERQLMNSGDLRDGSNFGKGQMAAADYTLSPEVNFKQSNMGSISGAARRLLPGSLFGSASVSTKSNEAQTTLIMIDNRSGVQVSSSVGSAKNYDFGVRGYSWGGAGWGGASGFTNTAEGKVILAAFADSYNQMVQALKNYKPQHVKGGLGTGGQLKVQGSTTPKATKKKKRTKKPKVTKKKSNVVVAKRSDVNVRSGGSSTVYVDEYDENALRDYYKALKKAVEHIGQYAAMGPQQIKAMRQYNRAGIDLWSILWAPTTAGKLETSKIELEAWPVDAKKKGWKILGKRIKKYNKLFYKHRKSLLANKDLDDDVRRKLKDVDLLTEKSLFADD